MIPIKCKGCQAEFNLKDELAGKKGKCPNCSTIFDIPSLQANQGDARKIEVICGCGASFRLDSGLIGKRGKCNKCGEIFEIKESPEKKAIESTGSAGNDEIITPGISAKFTPGTSLSESSTQEHTTSGFDRSGAYSHSKYGIKQKKIAINEKYYIKDQDNKDIMFSIRRIYFFRGLLSLIGGLAAGGSILIIGFVLIGSMDLSEGIGGILALITVIAAIVAIVAVMVWIFPKRHIEFHKSESNEKGLPEFTIEQDSKWEIITKNYTLRDRSGNQLAKFRKNLFTDILRKTWHINLGQKHIVVKEDSIILGLLRRFSPIAGLIRTNFIFIDATKNPKSNDIIGYFKRKFELFDNYVLDLTKDSAFSVPRQVAISMAVLLDTGEKR